MELHKMFNIGDERTSLKEIADYLGFDIEIHDITDYYIEWEDEQDNLYQDVIGFINQADLTSLVYSLGFKRNWHEWIDAGCYETENSDIFGVIVRPVHRFAKDLYQLLDNTDNP